MKPRGGTPFKPLTPKIYMADSPTRNRTSTLINRAYTKEFALQCANRSHPGRFSRVGSCFLDEFTEEVERLLVAKVKRHPTRGKTLLSSFPRTAFEG